MFSAPGVYTLNVDVLQGSATQRPVWEKKKKNPGFVIPQQLEFCFVFGFKKNIHDLKQSPQLVAVLDSIT